MVSPSISHEVMGPDAMILVSWMLSFKPTFSLFLFPFHQEALQFLFASIWPLTFTDSEQFFPKCGIKITGWLLKRTWFAEQIYWIISRKGMWTSFIIYVLKKKILYSCLFTYNDHYQISIQTSQSLVFNFTSSPSPLLFGFCFSVDNMHWKPIFLLLTDSLPKHQLPFWFLTELSRDGKASWTFIHTIQLTVA